MNQIELTNGVVQVVLLPSPEYRAFGGRLVQKPEWSERLTFDEYIREKRDTEDALRVALSKWWDEVEDFEVGADGNIAFTMCGGIYSRRIICRDYLDTLHRILRTTRWRDRWAYNTVIEPAEPIDGMRDCTFYVQADRITVLNQDLHDFNFVQWFSRSRAEAEAG